MLYLPECFCQKVHIQKHEMTHSSVTPYQCLQCKISIAARYIQHAGYLAHHNSYIIFHTALPSLEQELSYDNLDFVSEWGKKMYMFSITGNNILSPNNISTLYMIHVESQI